MERETRDALNRLAAATGAVHEAAQDLKEAMLREDGHATQGHEAAPHPAATGYGSAKRYPIAEGEKAKQCKGCGATIYFATTSSGKFMPVNPDGTSHMDTCPERDLFRKG